jgi:hypothetical protein
LTQLGSAPYTVTKHAAVALAEWLSITYGAQGLHVVCVCPQGVETAMLRRLGRCCECSCNVQLCSLHSAHTNLIIKVELRFYSRSCKSSGGGDGGVRFKEANKKVKCTRFQRRCSGWSNQCSVGRRRDARVTRERRVPLPSRRRGQRRRQSQWQRQCQRQWQWQWQGWRWCRRQECAPARAREGPG